MANDIKYPFMGLFAIYISSLVQRLSVFCLLFLGLFAFLLLGFQSF